MILLWELIMTNITNTNKMPITEPLEGNLRFVKQLMIFNIDTELEDVLFAGSLVEILSCELDEKCNSGIRATISIDEKIFKVCASCLTKFNPISI